MTPDEIDRLRAELAELRQVAFELREAVHAYAVEQRLEYIPRYWLTPALQKLWDVANKLPKDT